MKILSKLTIATALVVFVSGPAYADNLKKIKRKYDYVSETLSCGKVLVGDRAAIVQGPNGGKIPGVRNAQILDIESRSGKPLGYDVSLLNMRYGGDGDLFRIYTPQAKVGLLDACNGIVTPPQFAVINKFSDDGYAVAITQTDYTVLDRSGVEVIGTRLRHGMDVNTFNPVRRKGDKYQWTSYNNKIAGSRDGVNWGLFDIPSQQFTSPPVYEAINFYRQSPTSKPRYIVTKSGKQSALNIETGALLAPFKFDKFDRLEDLGGQSYIIGSDFTLNTNGQAKGAANAFNIATQSYVLPSGRLYSGLTPELVDNGRYSGRWKVSADVSVPNQPGHTSNSVGLYDEKVRRFLIEVIDRPTRDLRRVDGTNYYVATRSSPSGGAIYDASTGKRLTDYHKDVDHGTFLNLKSGGRNIPLFIASHKMSKRFWAYDGNGNMIHSGQGVGDDWAKVDGGAFILTERENRQSLRKSKTCLDQNYNILGAPKDCKIHGSGSTSTGSSSRMAKGQTSSSLTAPKLTSLACDHYMYKRKPNVANKALVTVSSTFCDRDGCYDKRNMIDNDRDESLGARHSWTNSGSGKKWATFSWKRPVKSMEQIYLVGTEGYEIGSYTIQVETPQGWKNVASVNNNKENKICHRFPAQDVLAVKIEGVGPAKQPTYFRLNEVVIR